MTLIGAKRSLVAAVHCYARVRSISVSPVQLERAHIMAYPEERLSLRGRSVSGDEASLVVDGAGNRPPMASMVLSMPPRPLILPHPPGSSRNSSGLRV